MSDILSIEEVDRDGAIREAAQNASGDTRSRFLKKGALVGGGLIATSAFAGTFAPRARAATQNDVAILNFALTLEYLEAAFYTEAVRMGALSGETLDFARVVGAHERAHVDFLKKALGAAAVKKPSFDFKGTTEDQGSFQATAIVLEDTGVMAYAGQAPLIDADAILAAALSVHSVEARHASWIRNIAGQPPAPRAFDKALTKEQVLAAVGKTGFIVQAPDMTSNNSPQVTG